MTSRHMFVTSPRFLHFWHCLQMLQYTYYLLINLRFSKCGNSWRNIVWTSETQILSYLFLLNIASSWLNVVHDRPWLELCLVTSSPQTNCLHPVLTCTAASILLHLCLKPAIHISFARSFFQLFLGRRLSPQPCRVHRSKQWRVKPDAAMLWASM